MCFCSRKKRQARHIIYTVGGVTKTNKTSGFASTPRLNVIKENGEDAFVRGYPMILKRRNITKRIRF